MAVARMMLAWLATLALFSTVSSYRFGTPKTLFSSAPRDPSLEPEGVRIVEGFRDESLTSENFDSANEIHRRVRRASSRPSSPQIIESDLTGEKRDTFYMHWPGDQESDGNILILARNKNNPTDSGVYLSTNFGKNWTMINSRLRLKNSKSLAVINQIYVSPSNSKLCILADAKNKHIFISKNLQTFTAIRLTFSPAFISFHPRNPNHIAGFDRKARRLFISTNQGQSFQLHKSIVKAFWWGEDTVDPDSVMFVERYMPGGQKTLAEKYIFTTMATTLLLDGIDEFDVKGKYMFATKTFGGKPKLLVSYKRKVPFKETKFPINEQSRDFFIYDILDDQVFVVINHMRNLSNMYLSDVGGVKYVLSLERVLYHNPTTDVSSAWLRTVVPYPFVDVQRIKNMRGVYIATQLTPGPVGRRHLRSLITYNRGGTWKRIRSPTRDIGGSPIHCYLPTCSLHFNLKYGSVYRISPSENLLSATSAPGLALALGVASTNLKIHPDLFITNDGGVNWKRALRGKHQFAFGDHGGVMVAVLYRRYTYTLRYSTNGGNSWSSVQFTSPLRKVLVQDIFTRKGEQLPIFLVYGSTMIKGVKTWQLFHVNMTRVLGKRCTPSDMMSWIPSDDRAGLDRCLLGRQVEYTIRNWTRSCRMGRNYAAGKVIKNCQCRRSDFECDFGFMQNTSSPELGCIPVPGEDLDNDLIPDNCPEGSSYKRSSGYRKIPGDTCVGGEQKYFLSKITPCPVKDLLGLTLTTNVRTSPLGVNVNVPVQFTAALKKGYWPNVRIGWDFGDGIATNGSGKATASQAHSFVRPGHYVVVLTVTNTRSILVKRLGIYVEAPLVPGGVSLSYSPPDPSIDQEITFLVSLMNYTRASAGLISYKWSVDKKAIKTSWQSVFKYTFPKSQVYNVTVRVSNIISVVSKSIAISVSKDIRPLSIKAVALGPTSVSVTWRLPLEASIYILGYKVVKSLYEQHGFSEATSVAGALTTSAVVNSLTPATKYYFKVMAFTSKGDGAFSDVVSTTTNSSVPGPPQNFRAYPTSATSMKVTWGPPKHGGQITMYTIHWWSEMNPAVKPLNVHSRATSLVFRKLKPDTLYSFEIFASSSIGPGRIAGPVHARTNINRPTLAPRNLKKMTDNGTCVLMSWNPPYFSTNDKRPFPAKGYKVYLDSKYLVNTSLKMLWICQLLPATIHSVGVSAYSVAGEGPQTTKMITLTPRRPSAPRSLLATTISPTSISLTWQAPTQINGRLLNYAIYQLRPLEKTRKVAGSATSLLIEGLKAYTRYEFAVAANNSAGLGARSSSIIAMTAEDLPEAPKKVKAELVQPESATIRLTWSTPRNPNGIIKGFKIYWSKADVGDSASGNQQITTVLGNRMECTFNHLEPATEYSFIVSAFNGAGEGLQRSSPARLYTKPAVEKTARLSVMFTAAEDTAGDAFPEEFIKAASIKADINNERIAALEVQAAMVLFNVLPRFKARAKSIGQVEVALNESFVVGKKAKTVSGSLRRTLTGMKCSKTRYYKSGDVSPDDIRRSHGHIKTYSDVKPTPTSSPGVVGAQKGQRDQGPGQTLVVGVAVPVVLIGLVLLAGMVFYYRKYKNLEKHYTNMSGIYRAEDDQLNIVYPADIPDDIHDRELIENDVKPAKAKKKQHKDEERRPLEEHDELAIV